MPVLQSYFVLNQDDIRLDLFSLAGKEKFYRRCCSTLLPLFYILVHLFEIFMSLLQILINNDLQRGYWQPEKNVLMRWSAFFCRDRTWYASACFSLGAISKQSHYVAKHVPPRYSCDPGAGYFCCKNCVEAIIVNSLRVFVPDTV